MTIKGHKAGKTKAPKSIWYESNCANGAEFPRKTPTHTRSCPDNRTNKSVETIRICGSATSTWTKDGNPKHKHTTRYKDTMTERYEGSPLDPSQIGWEFRGERKSILAASHLQP